MSDSTQPHFVRDYRKHVAQLLKSRDRDTAMQMAVGPAGSYESIGKAEAKLLEELGFQEPATVVDVGCGSGRLASMLAATPGVRYVGTDVVPELLDYAKTKCGRPDWRFVLVTDLKIPALDESADFVVFFSVLTHLTLPEGIQCLREARRVVKPDGQIVVSYIDRDLTPWWFRARLLVSQFAHRFLGRGFKVTLLTKSQLRSAAEELKLGIKFVDSPWIPRPNVTQDVCVFRRDQE